MSEPKVRSVLVICPNWVGDMVMATPVLQEVRNRFVRAEITVCVRPALAALIDHAPWQDRILLYDKKRAHKGIFGSLRFLRSLRKNRYDLAVVLPNSFRSGWVAWFSRARVRIGYDRFGASWMLTHTLRKTFENGRFVPDYMARYYAKLTAMVGAGTSSIEVRLPIDDANVARARGIWDSVAPKRAGSPKIAITPGASFGASKLWPPEYFAQVADLLGRDLVPKILLAPGPGEEPIAEEIKRHAQYPVEILPPSIGDLGVLKGLIHEADLLLSNDTGPRQMAHAFGVPVVVLMGPTDPRYSTVPRKNEIVLRHETPCSPCHLKTCPYEHHGCMRGISPESVREAALRYLSPKQRD